MQNNFIDAKLLSDMFLQGTYELTKNKVVIDALNVFPVPDGDTGTNMSLTLNSAANDLAGKEFKAVHEAAKAISKGSLMGARGNSGVILSQIFRGFSKACEGKDVLTSIDFCLAIKEASDTAYSAVLKPVEGTILTVIRKTAEKALDYTQEEVPLDELMEILIKRAEETLEKTPEYLEVLKQAGVVDSGGMGLVCIFKGFAAAINGEVNDLSELKEEQMAESTVQGTINTEDIKFAYCTEFIIRTSRNVSADILKNKIQTMGDSMVFVQDEDIIKVHIHTNNPGVALEEAMGYGDLVKIKIENMKEQHNNIITAEEQKPEVVHGEDFGFIAVAMGSGVAEILQDLGVGHVIEGGQTMNPSTEDFLSAIEECESDHIIILPNNSNIILAANQAKEISDKDVRVIPTKTIPQGISAMIEFDSTSSIGENEEVMCEAIGEIKTIQLTYAVRDTKFNDLDIEEGDYLGVADGTITSVGKEIVDVILDSFEKTIDEDSEILSIYYGKDVSRDEANAVAEIIEAKYEDLEVEIYYGGQPLYYYIFSVE